MPRRTKYKLGLDQAGTEYLQKYFKNSAEQLQAKKELRVMSIGHSTQELQPMPQFFEKLKNYNIKVLIDLRVSPRSGYNPKFQKDILQKVAKENDIEYIHLPHLGGIQEGYGEKFADYLLDSLASRRDNYIEVIKSLDLILNKLGEQGALALMCSEGKQKACHRQTLLEFLNIITNNVEFVVSDV